MKLFFGTGPTTADERRLQGAWLFLLSLAVFFISCIVLYTLYVMLRLKGTIQPFAIPLGFVFATISLVATSVCMHLAVEAVKREKRVDLYRYLVLASISSIVFFVIQSASMTWMMSQYYLADSPNWSLYGLTFFLALLHALHVIGGMVALYLVLVRSFSDIYDHEHFFPIQFCALYWHFLDFVWICMLVAFAIAAIVSK